jgi:bifunctional non-homologous end joining protein LigD
LRFSSVHAARFWPSIFQHYAEITAPHASGISNKGNFSKGNSSLVSKGQYDMNAPLKASLFYTEGSSDKEYHAEVIAVEGGNVVNFRYGRRGSSLKVGTKTATPVEFEQAKKIYLKLVNSKLADGYTPDAEGSSYQDLENSGRKTDFVPQLLNVITEVEAMHLIEDDDWVMSEKMDGERRGAHAEDSNIFGMNRKGLSVPLPMPVVVELQSIAADTGAVRVDGESIGDNLHVFDLHVHHGDSIRQSLGFLERITLARQMFANTKNIRVVPVAITTAEKRALWDKVKAANGEGLVFKRRDCVVTEGRPNSGGDWLKFKFIARATVLVSSISTSKRSVGISLFDEAGDAISVGNVTILPNYDIPCLNALVDVDYLYAYRGGSIYQPVYRGERTDLEISACSMTQLKFKPEGRNDEDYEDAA